jgi:hypothetical protein
MSPPLRQDGEPYALLTLAISLPSNGARLLLDQVDPALDEPARREMARAYVAAFLDVPPVRWSVKPIALTEFVDLIPGGDCPLHNQPPIES